MEQIVYQGLCCYEIIELTIHRSENHTKADAYLRGKEVADPHYMSILLLKKMKIIYSLRIKC